MNEIGIWQGNPDNMECLIWQSKPNQLILLPYTIIYLCLSMILIPLFPLNIIPLIYITYKVLQLYCKEYKLYTNRLVIATGILNKSIFTIESHRLREITQYSPLSYRIFNLGAIIIQTTDRRGTIILYGVNNPESTIETFRKVINPNRGITRIELI